MSWLSIEKVKEPKSSWEGKEPMLLMAEEQEKIYTVKEVARRIRVDETTVRRWIKNGVLEAIILPHRGKREAYRITQSTLDMLLKPAKRS